MRLHSFHLVDVGPIKQLSVDGLSDIIVLAGPNGVGKTNAMTHIMQQMREPNPNQNRRLIVQATTNTEEARWAKKQLDTNIADDASKLRRTLQTNQRRNQYKSSVLNFDSDRAIRNISNFQFSWDIQNPYLEDVGWDLGFTPLHNRYNDVRHSLFRLVESQRRQAADRAFQMRDEGHAAMPLDFPDVLKPFKDAFFQLLGPKKLLEVDIRSQEIFYEDEGNRLPLSSLSSGEREVVNIVFDFLLRAPSDCVIFFDEPELHLHPELSYRLLQTLARVGERNQFIFCTHSPEIISASLENTVIFVTPPRIPPINQAVVVHQDDETHHALQTLGQSIGVISLGKKLVLIEGHESSLDKQTYGAILKNRFPEFVMVPVGGKGTLRSFDEIRASILNKAIWGVNFYLLCDRDAVNAFGKTSVESNLSERIRMLPRYHLENYFLHEETLARAFQAVEPATSPLCDVGYITQKLKDIGKTVVPYAVALTVSASIREAVGNVSLMPKGAGAAASPEDLIGLFDVRLKEEVARVQSGMDTAIIQQLVQSEFARLVSSLEQGTQEWKSDLPGRVVLNKFAATTSLKVGHIKQLYLRAAETNSPAFDDLVQIFTELRAA